MTDAIVNDVNPRVLTDHLLHLLKTPSPGGYTHQNIKWLEGRFQTLGFQTERTRQEALKVWLPGQDQKTTKAMSAHVDTLGAMVVELKPQGTCRVLPIGSWSSRMAENCRITIHSDSKDFRGTLVPLKRSVHAQSKEVDEQPVNWEQLEIRVDWRCENISDLYEAGIRVGDIVSVDAQPEATESGHIVSRFLDDLGGVACLLHAAELIAHQKMVLPTGVLLLLTTSEESGTGASLNLPSELEEMVGVDIAIVAPGQNSREDHLSVVFMDRSGPYSQTLTRRLMQLCAKQAIEYRRDVFEFYFSDCAAALQAGNDLRHALIGFGTDASHGYERTHIEALTATTQLVLAYLLEDLS